MKTFIFSILIATTCIGAHAETLSSSTDRLQGVPLAEAQGVILTSVTVPPGDWTCTGNAGFGSPIAGSNATTTSRIAAKLSLDPPVPPAGFQPSLMTALIDATSVIETTQVQGPISISVGTTRYSVAGPTPVMLLGKWYPGPTNTGPEVGYGSVKCWR